MARLDVLPESPTRAASFRASLNEMARSFIASRINRSTSGSSVTVVLMLLSSHQYRCYHDASNWRRGLIPNAEYQFGRDRRIAGTVDRFFKPERCECLAAAPVSPSAVFPCVRLFGSDCRGNNCVHEAIDTHSLTLHLRGQLRVECARQTLPPLRRFNTWFIYLPAGFLKHGNAVAQRFPAVSISGYSTR